MASYKTLTDLPDIRGKRVLVRSELNVPIENGVAGDRYRVEMALPTIRELMIRGARVVVVAHLGRKPEESLAPVYTVLRELIPAAQFVPDLTGDAARAAVAALPEGGVLLLENLRSNAGETGNDPAFADALASFADYYVDDAFGAAHRAHASIVGVPARIPGFAGLLLDRELTELSKGLVPESPSLFILGGAKFETKEPLLEAALPRYDHVFIGGALANDFLKAEGFTVGKSLVSEGANKAAELIATGKLILPVDVVVEANDRQGLLRDITEVFAKEKVNVTGVKTQSIKDAHGGTAWMTFTVEVGDASRLAQVLAQVARVPGVRAARRR